MLPCIHHVEHDDSLGVFYDYDIVLVCNQAHVCQLRDLATFCSNHLE